MFPFPLGYKYVQTYTFSCLCKANQRQRFVDSVITVIFFTVVEYMLFHSET